MAIEIDQVWAGKGHRILIVDVVDTPWCGSLATVRETGDPRNTMYNLMEHEILKDYQHLDNPFKNGSICHQCSDINQYVEDLDYVCYRCKKGY